jgi:circadian clock protein KaiC
MAGEAGARLTTGIAGFDEILHGGFVPGRAYLVRGGPGTGKTTFGLHFLTAGRAAREKPLFITLGESEEQIRRNAEGLGFKLDRVTFLDLSPSSTFFSEVQTYDIFSPAEVEREPMTQKILDQVQALRPQRVFLDAMTQFRYLAADAFQFRRQALSFLRFLVEHGATVLCTSEGSEDTPDDDLQFMSDGVIHLKFSPEGRTISVTKFRGSDFRSGEHAMKLSGSGMEVFPRLLPENHQRDFVPDVLPSGVPELDELLHGGLERGTISIISGPTGVGKTTLGLQFMKEAAGRGERSVVYTFEEGVETLLHRAEAVHIPARTMIARGTLSVVQVEPLQYTPDEFASMVRHEVEERGAQLVMIDSTSGYRISLRTGDLITQLHALCKYLQNMGVAVLLISEIESITGDFRATDAGISYLADNVVFLRYLEVRGELRRAIGVLKKRLSNFEKTLREIDITRYGIKVGRPLTELRGILRGTPDWGESARKEG